MNEVSNRFHRSGGCFTHLTTSPSIITSELILTWIYACMILIDNHSQVWCPLGPSHQHHPTKRRALSVWGGWWGLSWWPMANYGWWRIRIIGGILDLCMSSWNVKVSTEAPKFKTIAEDSLMTVVHPPATGATIPLSYALRFWPKFLHLIILTLNKYVRSEMLNFRTCAQSSWPKSE